MMAPDADKICILGCGYLGSALARYLVSASPKGAATQIIGTTTTSGRAAELASLGITPLVLALGESDRLRDLLTRVRLIYLTIAPGSGRHGSYAEVYLGGVNHLIAALPGAVEHVIYTSSTSVYGQDDGSWVDEDSPVEPSTDNGRALRSAELHLLDGCATAGVTATILRSSGIWSADRGPHRLAARYAGTERDDGEAYLNLVHCDDVVTALAALREHHYHGVLNLNDDTPTTRRAYYDPLLVAAGLPPIRWQPGKRPAGKRVRNQRLKALLGMRLLHPRHDPT